jgi:hypothetical protein
MQNCEHCYIRLIISIAGELRENGTDSPDIVCQNCGQVNEAVKPAYGFEDDSCVTCGVEYGTHLRSNGRYYCTWCWIVWNS